MGRGSQKAAARPDNDSDVVIVPEGKERVKRKYERWTDGMLEAGIRFYVQRKGEINWPKLVSADLEEWCKVNNDTCGICARWGREGRLEASTLHVLHRVTPVVTCCLPPATLQDNLKAEDMRYTDKGDFYWDARKCRQKIEDVLKQCTPACEAVESLHRDRERSLKQLKKKMNETGGGEAVQMNAQRAMEELESHPVTEAEELATGKAANTAFLASYHQGDVYDITSNHVHAGTKVWGLYPLWRELGMHKSPRMPGGQTHAREAGLQQLPNSGDQDISPSSAEGCRQQVVVKREFLPGMNSNKHDSQRYTPNMRGKSAASNQLMKTLGKWGGVRTDGMVETHHLLVCALQNVCAVVCVKLYVPLYSVLCNK